MFSEEQTAVVERMEAGPKLPHVLQSGWAVRDELLFWWLGQAGFCFAYRETVVLIDPYLSDYLAWKYSATEFKHERMVASPVAAEEVRRCSMVLVTHPHSDHMDPWTLPAICQSNPSCTVVIPKPSYVTARERDIPEQSILTISAGETATFDEHVTVSAVPAAHEELERDEDGEYRHLGYLIEIGGISVYHSGDTILYEGLHDWMAVHGAPSLALLPVNGRDDYLSSKGIPGNLDTMEAVGLCRSLGASWLIPHHFGMFRFNTIDLPQLRRMLQSTDLNWTIPELGAAYRVRKRNAAGNRHEHRS